MLQLLLVGIGILILVKGNIKVSETREITRPQSVYWGLIIIAYGIASSFLSPELIYGLIFYISLILISVIFLMKGKSIESSDALKQSANTKRNVIILLVFIIILIIVFYLIGRNIFK